MKSKSLFLIWIRILRLHTLPLSISSVGLGNILAYQYRQFSLKLAFFSIATAISLQILANISNDYGDATHNVDYARSDKLINTKEISNENIKIGIYINIFISIILGSILIYLSEQPAWLWLILGALSILAAICYTVGKKPYGYIGLGDVSVFLFFGILAVCGTFFLQTNNLNYPLLLPTLFIGFSNVAVLNVNNIRDIKTDANSGKNTIAVMLGKNNAYIYHYLLIITSILCLNIFVFKYYKLSFFILVLILSLIWIIKHIIQLQKSKKQELILNKELKNITLFISLIVGLILAYQFFQAA